MFKHVLFRKPLNNCSAHPYASPLRGLRDKLLRAIYSSLSMHHQPLKMAAHPCATKTLISQSFLSFLFLILVACTPDEVTGPGEVRWDRETCARCNMAVGDRHYAAQVRGALAAEMTGLYKFDDIGCAVIWLDNQPWKNEIRTEIWVTDHRNGEWIDARKASYVTDRISPMNYGLGAQKEVTEGALDFSQAKKHIMMAEKERHRHGGHKPMRHE